MYSLSQQEQEDPSLINDQQQANSTADSGYFSPKKRSIPKLSSHKNTLLSEVNTNSMSPVKVPFTNSPAKQSMSEYIGLTDQDMEWEKDFFADFEDNLFSLDAGNNLIDDILRSPKGKEAMKCLMRSPKGKSIMSSPKGKMIKNRMRQLDDKTALLPISTNARNDMFRGTQKVGATPMKQDAQKVSKMSKRKLSMASPSSRSNPPVHIVQGQISTLPPIAKKQKTLWPTQQKLLFARNQFRLTLEKAVQSVKESYAAVEAAAEESKNKKVKGKPAKYPQLSKALSQPKARNSLMISDNDPSMQQARKRPAKNISAGKLLSGVHFENEDWMQYSDDENDLDWKGDLPFTGLKQAQARKKKTVKISNKRRKTSK